MDANLQGLILGILIGMPAGFLARELINRIETHGRRHHHT